MRTAPAHYLSTLQDSLLQTRPLRNLRLLLPNDKFVICSLGACYVTGRSMGFMRKMTQHGAKCAKTFQCPTTNMVTALPNRVFAGITQIM